MSAVLSTAVIELRDVAYRYGEAAAVLQAITLDIAQGSLVFIVGPNGAGKSTLLRLIAGLATASSGSVTCFGSDPSAQKRSAVARRLAFLPQSYDLTFPFTVEEIVLLGRYAHGRRGLAGFYTRDDDSERAVQAMARCDLAELANRRWDQLSGGEQRRVILAQAFCQDTELLLLDEPTASLDPAHGIDVMDAVRDRPSDTTALVVSHDLNLACRFGDRLLLLSRGKLVADGSPSDVLRSPSARDAFGVGLHVDTLPGTSRLFVVPK